MADGRFAILDPAAGISGDMLLGALLAAGAPAEWLRELPARLGLSGVRVEIHEVQRCGIQATKVDVVLPDGTQEHPSTLVAHSHVPPHQHAHDHQGPHRHVGELIAAVERAPLSTWVRERAVRAFRLLGGAEGRVHGVPAESVALHEVGVGSGWVRAAHGAIPVPAPATAVLLEGLDVGPNGPVTGEAVTPTGAVLL